MYLYLDCETRSELDIDAGSYKYLSHHSTELLMIAYAYGDGDVQLWEPRLSPIPKDLKDGLEDDLQILVAWNSSFERTAFRILLGLDIPIDRWEDPMIRSRYMSMPGSLEKVGKILDIKSKKLTEFFIKDQNMVQMFCTPLRRGGELTLFGLEPTTYRDWDTHRKEWDRFCDYCKTDVEAMREIYKRFSNFPLPDFEYELFSLNEKINDYGVFVDAVLLQGAEIVVDKEMSSLHKDFIEKTGIKNPRSTPAVLAYLRQHGYTFGSIGKPFINRALAGECDLDQDAKDALKLRVQLSKSSVSKLDSCKAALESDSRIRGLFNFMGAARTGRWSSGIVQVQNLIKSSKEVEKKQDLALKLLKAGDYEGIKKNFSSPIDVACSALRPIFRAPSGSKLIIADLAAIESRGAGWVSGCEGLLEVFRQDKDPYCVFAALMDPSKTYEYFYAEYKAGNKTNRNNAKPPFLGCGFGLTPGEIGQDEDGNVLKTGLLGYADNMGIELSEEYAIKAVQVYRNSYPEVCSFWWDLHNAFVRAVESDSIVEIGPLTLEKKGRVVCLWLPSGRALHYVNPELREVEKVSKRTNRVYKTIEILIDGIDQQTHQWTRISTYGPKLFENVVQAICRDILGCGMIEADKMGFKIVMTCHDEIVAEVPENGELTVEHLIQAMTTRPPWGKDFLIGAAGFSSEYYRKD